jgi:hypothetical protein
MLARLRGSLCQFGPSPARQKLGCTGKSEDLHIAEQPVGVKDRAPVRIPYARDDALGIGMQKCDGPYGGRRHKCARGARVPAERCVKLPPAIRVRGEKRVQNGSGVELCARREMEIMIKGMKRERRRRTLVHVIWMNVPKGHHISKRVA